MAPLPASPVGRMFHGLIVCTSLATAGCSYALSQPMPEVKGRLGVTVAAKHESRLSNLPLGVHQVPDTAVYISGHQGVSATVGAQFGVIGMLLAHAAAKQTGEKRTEGIEEHLRLDLVDTTERILAEELERRGDTGRVGRAGDASLEIDPYVVLTFIGQDQVRPWVVLRTALKTPKGEETWKTRYISGLGEVRPLRGPEGWIPGDAAPLRAAVEENIRTALAVLLRDAAGELRRGPVRTAKVRAQWISVKEPQKPSADVLEETRDRLIVTPKVADDVVFAGVNILNRHVISVTVDR